MILPAGVFTPAHQCPYIAAALRQFAERNGGGPPWLLNAIAEYNAAATSVTTSALGGTEVPDDIPRRTLTNVDYVGTDLAAKRIGIDARSVRDLCTRGSIEAELVDRRWLISNAAIDAYLRDRPRKGRR